MDTNDIICYFNDSKIYFYNNKNKNNYIDKLNNCTSDYRITNIESFSKQVNKIIRKNKLNVSFLNNKILLILSATYSDTDEQIIINIFDKLGFNKINLINETKLIKLDKKQSLIKINENNLTYFYKNQNKTEYIYFNFNQFVGKADKRITKLLNEYNKHFKIDKTILFGNNKELLKVASSIETLSKNKCYVLENNETYLIELVTK